MITWCLTTCLFRFKYSKPGLDFFYFAICESLDLGCILRPACRFHLIVIMKTDARRNQDGKRSPKEAWSQWESSDEETEANPEDLVLGLVFRFLRVIRAMLYLFIYIYFAWMYDSFICIRLCMISYHPHAKD